MQEQERQRAGTSRGRNERLSCRVGHVGAVARECMCMCMCMCMCTWRSHARALWLQRRLAIRRIGR